MSYKCEFCDKEFKRESTLAAHMCESQRRMRQKEDRGVQIGFQSFIRFFEITQGSAKLKTYEDFAKSPYYKAFVKFGWHVVQIRAVNIPQFIDWLVKNNKKLDHWCKDAMYTEYLSWYLLHESADSAMTRALEFSIEWAQENEYQSHEMLRYGNINRMAYAVSTGRISAWVLYNTESGQQFLSRLNTEQIQMIWNVIDSDRWQKKFHDYPADVEYVKQMMQKAGW